MRAAAIAAGVLVVATGATMLRRDLATTPARASDPIFGDWLALGSGCRARAAVRGDVERELVRTSATEPLRHAVRFHLPAFRLAVDGTAAEPARASECAIRLAVSPPPGFRIHDVRASTRVAARRGADSELRLHEQLALGDVAIGASNLRYSAGAGPREIDREVHLGTDLPDGVRPPQTTCGAAKLVGYDLTWVARRGPSGDPVRVELGSEKTLDLEVILEPCGGPGASDYRGS